MEETKIRAHFRGDNTQEEDHLGKGSSPKVEAILFSLEDAIITTKWTTPWVDVVKIIYLIHGRKENSTTTRRRHSKCHFANLQARARVRWREPHVEEDIIEGS